MTLEQKLKQIVLEVLSCVVQPSPSPSPLEKF